MGDWPQSVDQGPWTARFGAQLPAQATLNTKSTYAQLIASTDRMATAIMVGVRPVRGIAHKLRVDIAIGTANNEVVIIPDLLASGIGNAQSVYVYTFPIEIPAGSRIAARYQANASMTAGEAPVAWVSLASSGWIGGLAGQNKVSAYGVGGSTQYGTALADGTPGGTFGTWVELVAATDRLHGWFVVAVLDMNIAARVYYVRFGKGAGGVEFSLFGGFECACSVAGRDSVPPTVVAPVTVEGGARLAASLASDSNDGTLAVAVYGA